MHASRLQKNQLKYLTSKIFKNGHMDFLIFFNLTRQTKTQS